MESKETWKDIEGYEGIYQISNDGQVKSLIRDTKGGVGTYWTKERILKNCNNKDGYKLVYLHKDGKSKSYLVHRLVGVEFVSNPYGLLEINHKDENKSNNNSENLEWCGRKYNVNYGTGSARRAASRWKGTDQFDINGVFIRSWNSITIAGAEMKIDKGSISKCCKGTIKTIGGFKWEYTL